VFGLRKLVKNVISTRKIVFSRSSGAGRHRVELYHVGPCPKLLIIFTLQIIFVINVENISLHTC